jgi:phosphoglycerate dehydrogenase-like enzyme/predicted dehydrogenase
MSATRPVRALVIGAGPAAVDMHMPVLAQLRDQGSVSLALICDLDAARADTAARRFGFTETTGDAAAALSREDIDAVYLFADARLHFEYGLAALQHNKHLFVEKPAAPSFVEAQLLADTAASRGLIAVAGHNRRFYRSLALVRGRATAAGWRSVEAAFHKPEFGKTVPFGARSWLSANGIHALDAMIYMMGELPDRLSALSTAIQPGAAQIFSALLSWRSGAQGIFLCNNAAGGRREEYVFHGIGETCRVTDTAVSIERDGNVETTAMAGIGDGVAAEHAAFLEAIRDGVEPRHSLKAIAPSLFVAQLIEDGFSGEVRLPPPQVLAQPLHAAAADYAGSAILIDHSASMQSALAPLLPKYRLLTLRDLERSGDARPEVEAAILGRGATALSSDVLRKLPNLRAVGIVGLSLSRFDPEMLLAKGISLFNAGDAYADSVAEFALGLAILGRRRAFCSHAAMRAGGWGTSVNARSWIRTAALAARPTLRRLAVEQPLLRLFRRFGPPGTSSARSGPRQLRDALVGLIGWGQNAAAFAKSLARIGARVVVYSEHATSADLGGLDARLVSLEEALAADVVSLHRGLNERTQHFIGARELNKLRPGSVLINVARGGLIEPAALLERLKRGDIFACLDTFDEEPLERANPLRALTNVFLTSHIAGGSPDMHQAAAREVVAKVCDFLEGKPVVPLSRERLLTMT